MNTFKPLTIVQACSHLKCTAEHIEHIEPISTDWQVSVDKSWEMLCAERHEGHTEHKLLALAKGAEK